MINYWTIGVKKVSIIFFYFKIEQKRYVFSKVHNKSSYRSKIGWKSSSKEIIISVLRKLNFFGLCFCVTPKKLEKRLTKWLDTLCQIEIGFWKLLLEIGFWSWLVLSHLNLIEILGSCPANSLCSCQMWLNLKVDLANC